MRADKKILDLAIERGLVSSAMAQDDLDTLVRKGLLNETIISELRSELENLMDAATSVSPSHKSIPSPAPVLLETGPEVFGDFRSLEFIGQGGMAKVYKAFDTKLNRVVALKLLRIEDSEMAERLLMEAKTQAKIEHEHVCKVYEAGEVNGKPYIAMQFIKGKTFKEERNELPLELRLKLMAEVADAVHSAHRTGMIHRDLKPANIMIERNEDGEYIPFVMDFGLAREAGSSGMTETGRVVGTIYYMSPEQARGHVRRLDRRSDVYSLGITLYELISNQLPYEQESDMDFLVNLIDETKPMVRKMPADIPDDLETIVMKCVEKEPKRRYDSAKALADDLRRYLDGEPILAKRANLFYRISKKAKKHRVLFSIITLALITIVMLTGLWIRTRRDAAVRVRTAQELGQSVERIEAALRYTHLLPLHDATKELEEARLQVETIRQQIQDKEGGAGEGPAYYAAGRGYLALGQLDQARAYLERAWNAGYRTADVSYALGRTLGGLYQRETEETEQTGSNLSNKLRRKQLEKEFREPALRHLQQVSGPAMHAADYYRALVAFYDGRFDEALRIAADAQIKIPWLYEASRLQGDVYASQAREVEYSGNFQDALKLFAKAEQAYSAAVQIGASDPENYERLCRMKTAVVKSMFYKTTQEPKKEFDQAVAYCDQAGIVNPRNTEALAARAMAFNRWGEYQLFSGQDPEPALMKAIESAQKAARLNPEHHYPYHNLGFAYSLLSYYRIITDRNPLKEIEKSSDFYKKVLTLKPTYTPSLSGIGLINLYKAEYLVSIGQDPKESFTASIRYREEAVKNAPGNTDMMNNLGNCYDTYASYLIDAGGDPEDTSSQAIRVFQDAIKINPAAPLLRANLTAAYINRARYLNMKSSDISSAISQCVQSAEESIALNPNHGFSRSILVEAYLLQAANEINNKKSFEESLRKALDAIQVIIVDSSEEEMPYEYLGESDLLSAKANALKKASPESYLRSAVRNLNLALQQSPMDQNILLLLADCYLESAKWKQTLRRSNDADLQNGLNVINTILQKNPRNSYAHLMQAKLLLSATQSANVQITEANKSLDDALRLNRNLASEVETVARNREATKVTKD